MSDDCTSVACAGGASGDGSNQGRGGRAGGGHAGSSDGKSDAGAAGDASDSAPGGGRAAGGKPNGGFAGALGGSSSGAGDGGSGLLNGFPKTTVLDDFNREGPLGGKWDGDTGGFSLKEHALWCENCRNAALWGQAFGARQEVFATFKGFDDDANEINLVLKANAEALGACDLIEVLYAPAASSVRIAYCAEAQWFDLDETPLLLQPGDRFGARAYADGRIEVFHNAARVARYDVSEFPAKGGHIGVNGVAAESGLSWDDFGGGDF